MSTRSKRKTTAAATAAAATEAPLPTDKSPETAAAAVEVTVAAPAAAAPAPAAPPSKRSKKDNDKKDATTKPPPKKRHVQDLSSTIGSPTDPAHFDHYLFQLLAFKAEHQNFHVTKEDTPDLHIWLQFLKREYKSHVQDAASSQLTASQFQVLEHLHVPLTSRGDDHWNRFYELLKSYGARHGHVLVPRLCEVPGLGDWVTDQRRQYKAWKQGQSTQLTVERQEKLEGLGFAWQVRNRPEWEQRYKELTDYKKKHGDCKVPQHYKVNRALGKWVAKQREQYKLLKKGSHSFLTPYRLEKLDAVGFCWQVRTALDSMDELPPKAEAKEEEEDGGDGAVVKKEAEDDSEAVKEAPETAAAEEVVEAEAVAEVEEQTATV